jgi:hypothetical protein
LAQPTTAGVVIQVTSRSAQSFQVTAYSLVNFNTGRHDFWGGYYEDYSATGGGSEHYVEAERYSSLAVGGTIIVGLRKRGDGVVTGVDEVQVAGLDYIAVSSPHELAWQPKP